jgi:hypothetical protein
MNKKKLIKKLHLNCMCFILIANNKKLMLHLFGDSLKEVFDQKNGNYSSIETELKLNTLLN